MKLWHKIRLLWTWKYWPMELLYLPLTLYVFTIGALRTRRFFYFAAANPQVSLGGFAGDSKYHIIHRIPEKFRPKTLLILQKNSDFHLIEKIVASFNLQFPLIVKPDLGEGGFLVKKVANLQELKVYHEGHSMAYIIQEYIATPLELSVLIHNASGSLSISSVTQRKYLVLTGDGSHSVAQLLAKNKHTQYRQKNIRQLLQQNLENVLPNNEVYQPIQIGNWDFGATYIDRSSLITPALETVFAQLNTQVGLFDYARYDIKCQNEQALLAGDFKVLEINGVKGEPIHIYDDKVNLWQAYREIFKHWEYILQISKRNIKQGAQCPNWRQGLKILWQHRKSKTRAKRKNN